MSSAIGVGIGVPYSSPQEVPPGPVGGNILVDDEGTPNTLVDDEANLLEDDEG